MSKDLKKQLVTACGGSKGAANVLYAFRGYKSKYKFMDEKKKVWILENYTFFCDFLCISPRTAKRHFKQLEDLGLVKLQTGWHPIKNKKTLMILLTKKTRQLIGIKKGDNSAILRRIKTGQSCQNDTINSAKMAPSYYIYNKNTIKSLSDEMRESGENILNLEEFRKEKMMKEKTGKAQEILKSKSSKSFDEIFSDAKSKKQKLPKLKNTKVGSIELFWKQLSAIYFEDVYQVPWTGKEVGFAKALVAKVVDGGLDIEKLLVQCFSHWEQFGEYVQSHKGFSTFPEYPVIGFVTANTQQFVNFKPQGSVQLIARKSKQEDKPRMRSAKDIVREIQSRK